MLLFERSLSRFDHLGCVLITHLWCCSSSDLDCVLISHLWYVSWCCRGLAPELSPPERRKNPPPRRHGVSGEPKVPVAWFKEMGPVLAVRALHVSRRHESVQIRENAVCQQSPFGAIGSVGEIGDRCPMSCKGYIVTALYVVIPRLEART